MYLKRSISCLFGLVVMQLASFIFCPHSFAAGRPVECHPKPANPRGFIPTPSPSKPNKGPTASSSGIQVAPKPPSPDEIKKENSKKYNELFKQLAYDSQFKSVDKELINLRKYGIGAGVHPTMVDSLVRDLHNKGENAVKREQLSCSGTYDYSKNLGPNRNQDTLGWCYAYALADYFSSKTGKKISAAAIAITFNSYFKWLYNFLQAGCGEQEQGWGGSEALATLFSRFNGSLCLESEFPSEDNGNGKLYDLIAKFEEAKRQNSSNDITRCSQKIFPNLQVQDIANVLKKSSQDALLYNLSQKACVHKIPLPKLDSPHFFAHIINTKQRLIEVIDEQIKKGDFVTIGYNPAVLYDAEDPEGNDAHASIIVGRKWDQTRRQCVYLIRNSYGQGCHQYDPSLECVKGNIWVPRSSLSKGLYEVTAFH